MVLQIFVGNDAGRVKPHGFYQACRVTGRNTTACKEVDIEGTTVIEVPLDPSSSMILAYVTTCQLSRIALDFQALNCSLNFELNIQKEQLPAFKSRGCSDQMWLEVLILKMTS